MPHDCKGNLVQVGDGLTLRCKVKEVWPDADNCNVNVESILPEGLAAEYSTGLTCCSRLFEKVMPGIEINDKVVVNGNKREGVVIAIWEEVKSAKQYKIRFFDANDCSNTVWFYDTEFTLKS